MKYEMMRHALGIQEDGGKRRRWTKPFRNHYVAGASDVEIWDALVEEGLAKRTSLGNAITGGMPLYVVTDLGRERAIAGIKFARRWGTGEPTYV